MSALAQQQLRFLEGLFSLDIENAIKKYSYLRRFHGG